MNLGDLNLRAVNTSRPQLIHSASKQSITVSEDYYSLPSDSSSDGHAVRYQTPLSQIRSANASPDVLPRDSGIASIRNIQRSSPPPVANQFLPPSPSPSPVPISVAKRSLPAPVTNDTPAVKFRETPKIQTSGLSRQGSTSHKPIDSEASTTTPGFDDTPYIRFAIDQLTRDEELLGPRKERAASEASYPVDRIVPDEGLGYYGHGERSTRHDRQPRGRQSEHAPDNVFLPVDPPDDAFRYPTLNFVPKSLQTLSVLGLIIICILMIAALLFCNIWSTRHQGLWKYDGVGTSRYFLFQFLPQIFATIIIFWIFIIQNALLRVLPFSVLSGPGPRQNSDIFDDALLFPSTFLMPIFYCFNHREPAMGFCHLTFWLSLFTVPLQSAMFQTRYYGNETNHAWAWTAVRPVGWLLVVIYALLVVALLLVVLRFRTRKTGLMWDPISIADILVLFHRSNILNDFEGSEVTTAKDAKRVSKSYRLGYWTTSNQRGEAFYAIGEDHALVPRFAVEGGKMKAKAPANSFAAGKEYDLEAQRSLKPETSESLQRKVHSPILRYRWVPWFLKDSFVVAWIVIAIILMLAFVIVSFVGHPVERGFLPLLPAPTSSQGFSPANFVYSFVPSLIGMILFLLWQPIDAYFRALQPFANLSNTRGTTAEQSLLLDYPSRLPFEVTIKAALAGHYKVAWISFITLLSSTFPILAGGAFTAQFFPRTQDVRMAACLPAYEALVVFIIIYALSFLIVWPTRKRHLPHNILTLADLVSFFYQSPLLDEDPFREARSKLDLVTRLIASSSGGEKARPKYAFGVYFGRDGGREHLGIDRLQRPGSEDMLMPTRTVR
ncbi:hypothetical protein MMC31_000017 [Peltigera leucophlebia]|nr:hypothetical protein [Peltigera leucophlebia]